MTEQKRQKQAEKSRAAIKQAFQELLRSASYSDISVGDIILRADVGRSTFYRHFKNKADVLVALHEERFSMLFLNNGGTEGWLADEPSPMLEKYLCSHYEAGTSLSLSGDIGADIDYIMFSVTGMLAKYIQEGLELSFPDQQSRIPLPVLANSIAGIYNVTLMSWRTAYRNIRAEELARHIHQLTRAVVMDAYDLVVLH